VLYDFALTIPADTSPSAPVEVDVNLTNGVITRLEVEFHPGCNGMVYAYIRKGLHQLFPINPDGKARTDGGVVSAATYIELFYPPYELTLGGYSPGTAYDHEIIFRLELTPREVAERGKFSATILDTLLRLLGVKTK
jgi:hypothetical protein